jgi:hypothetical protein
MAFGFLPKAIGRILDELKLSGQLEYIILIEEKIQQIAAKCSMRRF